MKNSKKQASTTLLGLALLVSSLSAQSFLSDSFVTVPSGSQDKTNGEYREINALRGTNNLDVAGGSIVGFSSTEPWGGNSDNPRTVTAGLSSNSVASSGGSVEFRGFDDTVKRYVSRQIDSYTGPTSSYFSGSFSASVIDDNAVSLIAFSSSGIQSRADAFLDNSGDFYNGAGFGFVGDGSGSMDLVLRYRDNSLNYTQATLVNDISANQVYTVTGKLDWNSGGSGGTRELLTVWVNPQSGTEPGGSAFSDFAFAGDPTTLSHVILAQENFGTGLTDAVYMDEIRLGSSWSAISPIPEPSQAAVLFGLVIAGILMIRRRRNG